MTIRVQYVSGTVPDGVTQHVLTAPTHFQALGSLSSAFILPATTYPTVGLGTEGGLSQTRCWALNCDINSTSQILLNRGNETGATDFAFWIIEYVGPAGGPNEFIMRGKRIFNFDPDSAETTDSNPIFGITNVNRTVPFINGRHENANSSALRNFIASCSFVASGANWVAQLHRSLTTNGDPTYVVYAVEFTGSNWSVEPGFISFWTPNTNDDTPITPITVGKAWLYGHFRAGDRDTPAGQTFYAWLQGQDTLRTRTIEVSNTSVFRYWVIGNSDIRFGVSVQNNVNGVADIAAGGTGAQSQNLAIASAQDNGTVVTGWLGSSSTTTADQPSGCWRIRRVPNTPDLVEVYRSRSQGSTEYILQTVTFPTDAATTVTLAPQRGLLTLSGNVANGPVIREPATAQLFMRELGPFSEVFRTPGVGSIQLQGRQTVTPAFPGTALVSLSQLVPFLGLTKIIEIPVPALDYDSKVNAPPTVIIGTILSPEPAALSVQALQHAATEGGDIATRVPGVAILSMVADLAILGLENTNPVALPLVGLEPEVIRVSAIAEPEVGLLNAPGFAARPVGIFIPFQWIDVDPAPVVEWSD